MVKCQPSCAAMFVNRHACSWWFSSAVYGQTVMGVWRQRMELSDLYSKGSLRKLNASPYISTYLQLHRDLQLFFSIIFSETFLFLYDQMEMPFLGFTTWQIKVFCHNSYLNWQTVHVYQWMTYMVNVHAHNVSQHSSISYLLRTSYSLFLAYFCITL